MQARDFNQRHQWNGQVCLWRKFYLVIQWAKLMFVPFQPYNATVNAALTRRAPRTVCATSPSPSQPVGLRWIAGVSTTMSWSHVTGPSYAHRPPGTAVASTPCAAMWTGATRTKTSRYQVRTHIKNHTLSVLAHSPGTPVIFCLLILFRFFAKKTVMQAKQLVV